MPDSSPSKPQPAGQPAKPASPRQSGERGIDPVMAELVKTSAQSTAKACPQCKSFLPQNAAICTTCGYNLQTGKTVATRVSRAAAPAVATRAASGENLFTRETPWVWFAVYFVLGAAPAALTLVEGAELARLVMLGVSLCATLGMFVWIILRGFQESSGQGIALLLCVLTIFLILPGLYILYWVFWKNSDLRLKGAYGGALLASVLGALVTLPQRLEAIKNAGQNAAPPRPPAATGLP